MSVNEGQEYPGYVIEGQVYPELVTEYAEMETEELDYAGIVSEVEERPNNVIEEYVTHLLKVTVTLNLMISE